MARKAAQPKAYTDWSRVDLVLSIAEAAIICKASRQTLSKAIESGELKAKKIGNKTVIEKGNFQDYLGVANK